MICSKNECGYGEKLRRPWAITLCRHTYRSRYVNEVVAFCCQFLCSTLCWCLGNHQCCSAALRMTELELPLCDLELFSAACRSSSQFYMAWLPHTHIVLFLFMHNINSGICAIHTHILWPVVSRGAPKASLNAMR